MIKPIIAVLAILTGSFPGSLMSAMWVDYLSSQDDETQWANTVRGVARGKTGMGVLMESSGEAYDFHSLLRSLEEITSTKDLILPVGGLGSGRNKEIVDNYMRMIRYDKGERWRGLVFEQTKAVAAQFPQRQTYWQVGNEISSWHYMDTMYPWLSSEESITRDPLENIRLMEREDEAENRQRRQEKKERKKRLQPTDRNNSDVISLYVEYFLAPTAQSIFNVREKHPEYGSRIKIVLGTIANSHNEQARSWLENLLNYRIRGDYAEELAGRKVSEVVDIIALHYMASSWGPEWNGAMRELYGQWLGKGSIRGIWATEEIGRKRSTNGFGGASAISVLSRYMDLWYQLGISPCQGRVNFWGWNIGARGTRAVDAMHTLMSLIGETQLIPLNEGEVDLQSTGDYEAHMFRTTQGKLVVVAFASGKSGGFRFRGFEAEWPSENPPKIEAIIFNGSGQTRLEPDVKMNAGRLTVSTGDDLTSRDVILVVVDAP